MNRVLTVAVIGLLALLVGCGKAPSTAADVFMIDYAHESGGVLYHGTFNFVDGDASGAWTIDRDGHKETIVVTMREKAFRNVWDGLSTIEDFKKGTVKDPSQPLNPKTHHVVGIAFRSGGKEGMQTHLIPVETASPAFKEWLGQLGYPGK